jgi:hypothetical protein
MDLDIDKRRSGIIVDAKVEGIGIINQTSKNRPRRLRRGKL